MKLKTQYTHFQLLIICRDSTISKKVNNVSKGVWDLKGRKICHVEVQSLIVKDL